MSDTVLYDVADGIATVTLNRPDRLNAWMGELEAAYFDRLHEAAADPDVRVIVVTGAGRGFCAGADMDLLQGIGQGGGGGGPRERRPHRMMETTQVAKPVIAAINGACAGIGLVQALFCDVRFAAAGAKFTVAFSRRGLIAEHGISWVLPRLVGPARAMDVVLSSRVFLAEEALELGLVNKVVPRESLMDETLAYARDMADNCSPTALAVMKRQLWDDLGKPMLQAAEDADVVMKESLGRPDFKEGVASFLEQRPPRFEPYSE
jgi:enoyl-CoA hydratase/carnithine racemase